MVCFTGEESHQNDADQFSGRALIFLGKGEELLTPTVKPLGSVTELCNFKRIISNTQMLAMCLLPLRLCTVSVCVWEIILSLEVTQRDHS